MFTVYEAYGDQQCVYIGYVEGSLATAMDHLEHSSIAHSTSSHPKALARGDVRFGEQYKFDFSKVKYKQLEVCATRVAAHVVRDEHRASNLESITPPNPFPPDVYDAATKKFPKRVRKYNRMFKARTASIARYALDVLFTYEQVNSHPAPREQKIRDLDALKPDAFMVKYGFALPPL